MCAARVAHDRITLLHTLSSSASFVGSLRAAFGISKIRLMPNARRASLSSPSEGLLRVSAVAKKSALRQRFFLTLNFQKTIPSLAATLRFAASMFNR
jgi:hypothetical protein